MTPGTLHRALKSASGSTWVCAGEYEPAGTNVTNNRARSLQYRIPKVYAMNRVAGGKKKTGQLALSRPVKELPESGTGEFPVIYNPAVPPQVVPPLKQIEAA